MDDTKPLPVRHRLALAKASNLQAVADSHAAYEPMAKALKESLSFLISVSQSAYATELLRHRLDRANAIVALLGELTKDPEVKKAVDEYFATYDQDDS